MKIKELKKSQDKCTQIIDSAR